jgi:C1A family cysteine protease
VAASKAVKKATKRTVKKTPPKKTVKRSVADHERFICNLRPSKGTEGDWGMRDSVAAGAMRARAPVPTSVDLRSSWWSINNQENTGSCVGWSAADGVVRYHMVKSGRIREDELLSPRHLWMASKETDSDTTRPETFIEEAGTTLKTALDVARKHGVALMDDLPFHIQTSMFTGRESEFYAKCAQRKITSYFNLRKRTNEWKQWLANNGPILAGLTVDQSWYDAATNGGNVDKVVPVADAGGHAVCIVGYRTDGRFIVRNSWGTDFGDKGFAYVHPDYVAATFFDEAYGVTV